MLKQIESNLETKKHWGIFFLRLFIGARLLYGVVDNVFSWERMLEFAGFLESNGFPMPIFSAVMSVYVQFLCGIFILVGYKIRIASFILILNFLVALVFVHIQVNDSIEGMTPALAMLFGAITFLFTGADQISIDNRLKK